MKTQIYVPSMYGRGKACSRAALRVLLALLGPLCLTFTVVAQTNHVLLGGFKADPTRILAKFKDANQASAAATTLGVLQSKINHRFQQIPKWAVLEDTVGLNGNASESIQRARLLSRIAALQNSGLFEYVEPDYLVEGTAMPTDQAFANGVLWGLRNYGQSAGLAGGDVSATNAWDITTGSTNVIVAIIDSGIRYTHRDLTNQMWRNPGEIPGNGTDDDGNGFIDDVFGINAITGSGNPSDDNDHGTHCAGTIGASANDANPHVGVAWQVRLMGCKFLAASGSGRTSDAIKCVDYAVSKGARILNNSWGGGGYNQALFDSIDNARRAGVLFLAAAGNSAADNDQGGFYPANYPLANIISVAAVDRNDQLASFSDYGLTTVHLAAPGVAIYSSTAGSDTEYQLFDGTSMATPHVAGAAALILAQFPGADLDELKARLLMGAVPIPALAGKTITGGRLNVYRSLTLSGSGILQLSVTPPSTSFLLSSAPQPIRVKVTDLFGVPNATVSASITGVVTTNLTLLDNGTAPDTLASDAIYSANFFVPAVTGAVTMTIVASATNKVSVTNVLTYTILPPPPNDFFTNATKVPAAGGLYFANNRFATMEASEPKHAAITNVAGSLWWAWTPSVTTNGFVDTTGSGVDTVVAVYSGNSVVGLQQIVATNDIGQVKQGYVSFNATNGATYRIAIASVNTNSLGSIQLRVIPGGQPDITAPVVSITSPSSGVTVTSNLVVISGTAFDPAPNATGVSEVLVSVNGAVANTAAGSTNWTAPALLAPGINSIVVLAYDQARNASASVSIQINYFANNPVNDFFANASVLSGASGGDTSVYTTNATKEFGEPSHVGNLGGKSAWWRYQPAVDGLLRLTTTNSSFDTLLAIYSGSQLANLAVIAQNDDAYPGVSGISELVAPVRSNQVYSIAVDGYDAVSGHVVLGYSLTPAKLFHLTINSTPGGTTSPTSLDVVSNTTVSVTALPNAGYGFDVWDGDVVSLANPVFIQMNGDRTLTAHFRPVAYSDGFESGTLAALGWTTGGNLPWLVQTNTASAGTFAARSGGISHNQSSSLFLTADYRAGTGSFDYRISSEPTWDVIAFYLDGILQHEWSGQSGWNTFSFPMTAGAHSLEWRYTKDGNTSVGLDAAFIDNVNLPVRVNFNASTPAQLIARRQSDGLVFIDLSGQANQLYLLQASADLNTWQTISTNVLIGGVAHILDPGSFTNKVRFYRALAPAP